MLDIGNARSHPKDIESGLWHEKCRCWRIFMLCHTVRMMLWMRISGNEWWRIFKPCNIVKMLARPAGALQDLVNDLHPRGGITGSRWP